MARKNKDVFGFDELEKSFKRFEKKYPDKADALLMTQGQAVNRRTKSLTQVKTKKLRNSWRLKKVKLYKGGTVRVVRIQTRAPHGHLVELGHEQVSGGRTREKGQKLNRVQRFARGIKSHGRVEGKHMLSNAIQEAQSRFDRDANKMLDKLVEEFNND